MKPSIQITHPELIKEWDYEKNSDLVPKNYTAGSNAKVWWKCSACGYEWEAYICNRTKRGSGCPQCAKAIREKHKLEKKIKDNGSFEDWCHKNGEKGNRLLKEWDAEKNGELLPSQLTYGSQKTVWWKCNKGHSWQSSIKNRVADHGCAVCDNRQIIPGVNDLQTTHPNIADEWNYRKNGELLPSDISYGSEKKVWWICEKGHEWIATPNARTSNNSGCPVCAHFVVDPTTTSLAAKSPLLISEWNYEKNNGLTPDLVFPTSKTKVWWKCSICGHEWLAEIGTRFSGEMCPKCTSIIKTSFPEQAIYYYVKQTYPDAVLHFTDIFNNKMELDIYIPSIKTGLEYDGGFWHHSIESEKREKTKYNICQQNDIKLIRIIEATIDNYRYNCDVQILSYYTRDDLSSLDILLDELGKQICIPNHNCEKDEFSIKATYYTIARKNRLSITNPELINEWDYDKNNNLTPDMFFSSSGQRVWWKCKNGHSWKQAIYVRSQGHGCPYCSNLKVWPGFNDFATMCPELLQEWNVEKNSCLLPENTIYKSNIKAWWKCKECGYEWQATPYNRGVKGTGCPVCSNHIVVPGINDLATTNPVLLKEWDYEKNKSIKPNQVIAGSTIKVWWKCKNGHSWETSIRVRTRGCGCPYCKTNKKESTDK